MDIIELMKTIYPVLVILLLGFVIFSRPSTAQANSSPVIIDSPDDLIYEYRTSFNSISWIVVDSDPSRYTVSINDVQYNDGIWTSNEEVSISIDGLSIGINNLQITFFDLLDQSVSDTVLIVVEDTTAPLITRVPDQEIVFGSVFNFLSWSALDSNPNNYIITLNDEFFREGFWISGRRIAIQIDDLEIGIHEVKVTFFDDYQNLAMDLVIINVVNTNNLEIVSNTDQPQDSSILKTGVFMLLLLVIIFSLLVFYAKNKK